MRALSPLAAALALLVGAGPDAATAGEELPPARPTTGYAATIRNSIDTRSEGRYESEADTVEVRVAGTRLREKSRLLDRKIAIVDIEANTVIELDPDAEDRVAHRFRFAQQPMPYVEGRSAFGEDWGPPRIAGRETIAKHACTVLHYGEPETEGISACVSDQGVLLRAHIRVPDFERQIEVLEFAPGPQEERWFRPPEGFRVDDAIAE